MAKKYTDYIKEQKIEAVNKKYQEAYSGELTLVLARLLQNKDFRFFISDLIGYTSPFKSAFEEKGNVAAFNSGKQDVGLKIFNDVMAVDPDAFLQLMKEEAARKQFYDKIIEEAVNDHSK